MKLIFCFCLLQPLQLLDCHILDFMGWSSIHDWLDSLVDMMVDVLSTDDRVHTVGLLTLHTLALVTVFALLGGQTSFNFLRVIMLE